MYEGWLDAARLLRSVYPTLDSLAWLSVDSRYVIDQLRHSDALAKLPAPAGGWDQLNLVSITDEPRAPEALLCLDTELDTPAYFRDFPMPCPDVRETASGACAVVQVDASFRLGTSVIPLGLLSKIACGDALVIQSVRQLVTIGEKPLCSFQHEGMNIMLDQQINDHEADDLGQPFEAEPAEAATVSAPGTPMSEAEPFSIDELPVQLEFILDEQRFSVAELARLQRGMVLPMQAKTPMDVKIRANGRFLGMGELIQLGEQLAVQVHSLRSAQKR
ncbi:hypothetical protein AQ914_04500 [Burkholderia pseudomallei]|nr:hypothetical protein AQ914_04500 [Burkholderia pseudomallei]